MINKGDKFQTKILVRYKLGGVSKMTPKEKLLESIERLISAMDEEKLKNVYQFVLHISK